MANFNALCRLHRNMDAFPYFTPRPLKPPPLFLINKKRGRLFKFLLQACGALLTFTLSYLKEA